MSVITFNEDSITRNRNWHSLLTAVLLWFFCNVCNAIEFNDALVGNTIRDSIDINSKTHRPLPVGQWKVISRNERPIKLSGVPSNETVKQLFLRNADTNSPIAVVDISTTGNISFSVNFWVQGQPCKSGTAGLEGKFVNDFGTSANSGVVKCVLLRNLVETKFQRIQGISGGDQSLPEKLLHFFGQIWWQRSDIVSFDIYFNADGIEGESLKKYIQEAGKWTSEYLEAIEANHQRIFSSKTAAKEFSSTEFTKRASSRVIFSSSIPCGQAPVMGFPFKACWATSGSGPMQQWKIEYSDAQSELAIGFDVSQTSAQPIALDNAISVIKTAPALAGVLRDASNWANLRVADGKDFYINFQKSTDKQCMGVVQQNIPSYQNAASTRMFSAFCKVAESPMTDSEVKFLLGLIKVRK